MKKADRQKKIREIITARSIERQEDLVGALNELGLQVTQATISRDIKEMQLIKVPAENGGYRYALPVMQHRDEPDQLGTAIHDSLVQLKRSDRLLALAVRPGNGPVVANLLRRLTDRGSLRPLVTIATSWWYAILLTMLKRSRTT